MEYPSYIQDIIKEMATVEVIETSLTETVEEKLAKAKEKGNSLIRMFASNTPMQVIFNEEYYLLIDALTALTGKIDAEKEIDNIEFILNFTFGEPKQLA